VPTCLLRLRAPSYVRASLPSADSTIMRTSAHFQVNFLQSRYCKDHIFNTINDLPWVNLIFPYLQ